MTSFRIVVKPASLPQQFKTKLAGTEQRLTAAVETAMNMIRSMLEQTAQADIRAGGNFGSRWTDGLHVNLEGAGLNMRIYMTHDIPYAPIFETGGTITGSPLLWIPLSGTDAAGQHASDYGGGLFSARYPRYGGPPLLFAVSDKRPRYFGIESVTIPRKWHLEEDAQSAADNFRNAFDVAWAQAG